MWQNLEMENIMPVTYRFASHCLNILGKKVITDSVMAQNCFRNHHIPCILLKEFVDSVKSKISVGKKNS